MGDKYLTAGGVFFYEERNGVKGLWLVKEYNYGEEEFTDFGGKYDYNDGDIFATIVREFREETYNTQEIAYKDILSVPSDCHIYINGWDNKPVYMCIPVHINTFKISFDAVAIKKSRERILKTNAKVPSDWYSTRDVCFVPLDDIEKKIVKISNRLKSILREIIRHIDAYNETLQIFFSRFYV